MASRVFANCRPLKALSAASRRSWPGIPGHEQGWLSGNGRAPTPRASRPRDLSRGRIASCLGLGPLRGPQTRPQTANASKRRQLIANPEQPKGAPATGRITFWLRGSLLSCRSQWRSTDRKPREVMENHPEPLGVLGAFPCPRVFPVVTDPRPSSRKNGRQALFSSSRCPSRGSAEITQTQALRPGSGCFPRPLVTNSRSREPGPNAKGAARK